VATVRALLPTLFCAVVAVAETWTLRDVVAVATLEELLAVEVAVPGGGEWTDAALAVAAVGLADSAAAVPPPAAVTRLSVLVDRLILLVGGVVLVDAAVLLLTDFDPSQLLIA
jgi:hypothetical protein